LFVCWAHKSRALKRLISFTLQLHDGTSPRAGTFRFFAKL
jgi:hypothetical protein